MKFLAVLAATLPVIGTMALPALESRATKFQTIHPNGDSSKCVGVVGGVFTVGAYVDIYDCNGSITQKWGQGEGADGFFVKNPADGKNFCMQLEDYENLHDGTKIQLGRCATEDSEDGNQTQSFGAPDASNGYTIRAALSAPFNNFKTLCLDLTDGSKANRNVLQVWTCSPDKKKPYTNQIWKLASA